MQLHAQRVLLIAAILAALACNAPGTRPSRPVVQIQSPVSGAVIPVGEPLIVSSVSSDPGGPGVTQVELFVDGESVLVDESPSGARAIFDLAQSWTPEREGQITLTVIAYRADGTPSIPASVSVTVVGLSSDSTQASPLPGITLLPGESPAPSSPVPPAATAPVIVQGRVVINANIRSGPGPFCDIIGGVKQGEVINLLELSRDRQWYKTDYLGQSRIGWIFNDSVALLGDIALIPVGTRSGCRGCGDGVCFSNESCDSCPEDCGLCCGNQTCEPQYGEDCGTCQADCGPCCGNGLCEPSRGEDCGTCQVDCGPCCGNAVCEPGRGETCATCPSDCGKCCGNGLCEAAQGEDCATCPGDCGVCCGNGLCEPGRGETCLTCAKDCGVCTPTPPPAPVCGNGIVEPGEACDGDSTPCGALTCQPNCTCG